MGEGKFKRKRNKIIKDAKFHANAAAQNAHIEIIRNYIDGIIELKFKARFKVCFYILRKINPFGGKYFGKN